MTDLTKNFEAIEAAIAGLMVPENEGAQTLSLTPEQFVNYCNAQIELAKSGEDTENRLKHVSDVVALMKSDNMGSWCETDTRNVAVFSGELSVQAQSRWNEKMEANFSDPPQAPAASGGFESPTGITGPASNTALPEARHMPGQAPQSEPAASPEGFMAKAKSLLAKSDGGEALLAELQTLLDAESGDDGIVVEGAEAPAAEKVVKDDGWPADLATGHFLEGTDPVPTTEDFGSDPDKS
jgi:hypothetical protein